MEANSMIRPLGRMETYSTTRHWMGHYQCVGNTCTYAVPSSHLARNHLRTVIEQALARVVLALPSLQVGIADEATQSPYFVQLPSIDLATHLEWRAVDQPDEVQYTRALLRAIEVRHDTSWSNVQQESPWKLLVFEDVRQKEDVVKLDLMFAVHHALSDGKSTSVFHAHLLRALHDTASRAPSVEDHVLHLHSPSVIIPSQEELVNFRISCIYMFKALWGEFAPSWLRGAPPTLPWTGGPVTEGSLVNVRLIELPPEKVTRLLELCRGNGTTIMPLLQSIILLSLSQRLSEEDATAFAAATVISLRPYVDEVKLPASANLSESMTDLVTACSHVFDQRTVSSLRDSTNDTIETNLWTVARRIREGVKTKADTLPNDDVTGLLSWVDFAKRATGLLGKPREHTWELSNIGSMPGAYENGGSTEGGSWKLIRSIFTQSAHIIGPAFCVNVSWIDGGVLTITLTWQDETVGVALMDGIKGDLNAWVERLSHVAN